MHSDINNHAIAYFMWYVHLLQGLKANLNRLFNTLTEESILECKAANRYPKLLYALAFYHSVLLERRKFRTLGFNNFYDFNDTDFKVGLSHGADYLSISSSKLTHLSALPVSCQACSRQQNTSMHDDLNIENLAMVLRR